MMHKQQDSSVREILGRDSIVPRKKREYGRRNGGNMQCVHCSCLTVKSLLSCVSIESLRPMDRGLSPGGMECTCRSSRGET